MALYEEPLNHVFLGSFVRFLDDAVSHGHVDVLRRSIGFLEVAMGSPDDRVVELIAVSFVENLPGSTNYRTIVDALGPKLKAELARQDLPP